MQELVYEGPGGPFRGMLALPGGGEGPHPGILVAPTVRGRTGFEEEKARALAALGYVALALDPYGPDFDAAEPFRSMNALNADRPLLASRMVAALDALRARPEVDAARIGAIGFCFGGKCVLDLARTGAEVAAIVSFHGVIDPPPAPSARILGRVLVCHGWDDPLAKPDAVLALADELTRAEADWQILAFGHTGHAFTNPDMHKLDEGLFHQPDAERRSWETMQRLFAEAFAAP